VRTPARIRRRSFIDRYVFPDGELHGLGAVAEVGLGVRGAPRGGYARALRADASGVVRNLEQSWDVAVLEAVEAPAGI
jgi:cyclopropane-fatty-acyl-phospholipid synthase